MRECTGHQRGAQMDGPDCLVGREDMGDTCNPRSRQVNRSYRSAVVLIIGALMLVGCPDQRDATTETVRWTEDQGVLAKIALEAEDPSVRARAVEKLTDQALLAKIAVEDKHLSPRAHAVEKLTDQALLAKIAVEDENYNVRHHAVQRLTDQALLAKIAVEDEDPGVRDAATAKLKK